MATSFASCTQRRSRMLFVMREVLLIKEFKLEEARPFLGVPPASLRDATATAAARL